MLPMRRFSLLLAIAIATAGCSADLYESPDFGVVDAGPDVVLWRLAEGPEGFVGIGGPIQPEDLEEGPGPLTLASYRSIDGRTWELGETLGTIDTPLLGLTAWEGGYASSGMWDGTAAVMVSTDGLSWRRFDLPAENGVVPEIEPAGIAATNGTIVITGFTGDPAVPLVWVIDPDTGPTPADTTVFPQATRLNQAIAGPVGFVAAATGSSEGSNPAPIWVSTDGLEWRPVADPFGGETLVTGLIGSSDGYVAVVDDAEDDDHFTLWTSTDGVDWTRQADQDTVFGHLAGKGGNLLRDLGSPSDDDPEPRPLAFSFNGRWLEITEAVAGSRFVAVAVAGSETVRLVSGFIAGDEPIPLVLLAGG